MLYDHVLFAPVEVDVGDEGFLAVVDVYHHVAGNRVDEFGYIPRPYDYSFAVLIESVFCEWFHLKCFLVALIQRMLHELLHV